MENNLTNRDTSDKFQECSICWLPYEIQTCV